MRLVWGWLGQGVLSASPPFSPSSSSKPEVDVAGPLAGRQQVMLLLVLPPLLESLGNGMPKGEFLTVQGEEQPWACAKVSPGELPKSSSMLLIL